MIAGSARAKSAQAKSAQERLRAVRSALFLPASNPRAIVRAREVGADLVILDLEDAVRPEDKAAARTAAPAAAAEGFGGALVAIRVNGISSEHHAADVAAVAGSAADFVVLPMIEAAAPLAAFAVSVRKPVLAMIETSRAVLASARIAATPGVVGLIAGTNDLCAQTGIRNEDGRAGLVTALQSMVLSARAADIAVFDGVYNRLDDLRGFEAEARQGVAWGFDGKALIHPDQVAPANRAFSPTSDEVEDAQALIDAAGGGAQRFRGRMIEALHVGQARRVLARTRQA